MRFTPRPYQEEAIRRGVEFFRSPEKYNAIEVLPTGCHAKGYGIMMYDGTIKNVENIKIGDVVMGNDSTPRHVLELHRGQDDMYRITPIKGEPFVVNAGHILHLHVTPADGPACFEEISVSEYIKAQKANKIYQLHTAAMPESEHGLLVTGFSIEHIGKGDYYGFTLDGNNLYLDWQFFVHHNSGKSLVIAEIAHRLDTDILVFQPSKEILQQNYAKMLNYVDEDEVGIYSSSQGAGKKYHQVKRITFATIGSVKQHVEEFKHFKVILIDECHGLGSDNANGMYLTFLGMLDCKVLGFTATPYRLTSETYWEPCATMIRDKDGNKVLDKHGQPRFKGAMRTKNAKLTMLVNEDNPFFSKIIYCIQVKDLLDMGYLAQLRYFEVRPPRWNTQRMFKNTTGTEYSEKSVKWMMEESDLNTHIANLCSRLLRPKNGVPRNGILVFTQFVDDAEYITNELNAREGRYCAAYVSGSTTKQNRERILQEFRDGTIQILLNVNCFSTGLDIPKLDTIVLGRPTLSLALHYQSVGRAIRPYENKDAWIIDTVGNTDRFGEVGNLFIGEGDDGKPETFGWVFNYEQGMVSWTQLTGVYLGKSDKS